MNQTLSFCRQFVKEVDGYLMYRGEDAMPLCLPDAQAVADGLGGSGAIYHRQVHPDCFDPELVGKRLAEPLLQNPEFFAPLQDLMTDEGWNRSHDQGILEQMGADFFELHAVKDCYTGRNLKRSAYFGSRTAMTLFRIFALAVDRDKVFELAGTEEGLVQLENAVSRFLFAGMEAMAEAAQLQYECMIQGLSMLGTTLCAALIRQTEEEKVEVLYFTCGDSQAYILSGDGLALACGNHKDGMSTHLNISFPEKARVKCTLRQFETPCMLFCATDGCFDALCFRQSPLIFEMFLLDSVCQANSMEEFRDLMIQFFDVYGCHDDSSSMAAALYGMDYAGLKEMAQQRKDALHSQYVELAEDDTFLTCNYQMEHKRLMKEKQAINRAVESLVDLDKLWESCARYAEQIGTELFEQKYPPEMLENKSNWYIQVMAALLSGWTFDSKQQDEEVEQVFNTVKENQFNLLTAQKRKERQLEVFADYQQTFDRYQTVNDEAEEEEEV